jgi:hypothetical protein
MGRAANVVSPVRYAQSLLRRIEQLAGELKEIVERGEVGFCSLLV